jgi:hypothetical protein
VSNPSTQSSIPIAEPSAPPGLALGTSTQPTSGDAPVDTGWSDDASRPDDVLQAAVMKVLNAHCGLAGLLHGLASSEVEAFAQPYLAQLDEAVTDLRRCLVSHRLGGR